MGEEPSPQLDLLFFGTPEFAVPSLKALAATRHRVVGVISQPDRRRGRGRRARPTPIRETAEALGLPVLQPERVGAPDALAWMRERAPALGVVVAFGQFIPRSVRELPEHGLINAHASLLPSYRGAAPIQHSVLAGDRETGITIIRVAREMDAGDWCVMRSTPIGLDENAGELAERLSHLAADTLLEAVDRIAAGSAVFRPQDHARATLAPKIGPEFGRIRWDHPCQEILRRLRAATPQPGCRIRLESSGVELRLIRARLGTAQDAEGAERGAGAPEDAGGESTASGSGAKPEPGSVWRRNGELLIAGLDGWISVQRVLVPGRRAVATAEYLRGARIPERDRVQDEEVQSE